MFSTPCVPGVGLCAAQITATRSLRVTASDFASATEIRLNIWQKEKLKKIVKNTLESSVAEGTLCTDVLFPFYCSFVSKEG